MATFIGLSGDWHGNVRWAESVLQQFADAEVTTVLHAGDFGIWPGMQGASYLSEIMGTCSKLGITLLVVPGNHEDYTQINDPEGPTPDKQVLGSGDGWEVSLLPRGYKFNILGRNFLAFGGAPSIDFEYRKEGISWWPEEMIRDSDLDRLTDIGSVDVMIAHDAPDGGTDAVQRIIDTPVEESMWSKAGLDYCAVGRMKMNKAVEIVNPRMFVHGHMHVADEKYYEDIDRRYVSLGPDGDLGNVAVLELETMQVGWARPITEQDEVDA